MRVTYLMFAKIGLWPLPSAIPFSRPSSVMGISRFAKCHSEEAVQVEQVNWCGCVVAPSALENVLAASPAALPLADWIRPRLCRPTCIQCTTCSGKLVAALQTVVLTCRSGY